MCVPNNSDKRERWKVSFIIWKWKLQIIPWQFQTISHLLSCQELEKSDICQRSFCCRKELKEGLTSNTFASKPGNPFSEQHNKHLIYQEDWVTKSTGICRWSWSPQYPPCSHQVCNFAQSCVLYRLSSLNIQSFLLNLSQSIPESAILHPCCLTNRIDAWTPWGLSEISIPLNCCMSYRGKMAWSSAFSF